MIEVVKCTTFKQILGCDNVSTLCIDMLVFMEDPYEMLRDDFKKVDVVEEQYLLKVELGHFMKQCIEGNPYYLTVLSKDSDEWISEKSYEYMDLQDCSELLMTNELVEKLIQVATKFRSDKKVCEAVNTLHIARGILDKKEIIIPKNFKYSLEDWESNIDKTLKSLYKTDIPDYIDKETLHKKLTKIRKSVKYG